MTATSRPGMVGTWLRNIEPNLPAPISADADRPPGRGALLQQPMEVHRAIPRRPAVALRA